MEFARLNSFGIKTVVSKKYCRFLPENLSYFSQNQLFKWGFKNDRKGFEESTGAPLEMMWHIQYINS